MVHVKVNRLQAGTRAGYRATWLYSCGLKGYMVVQMPVNMLQDGTVKAEEA